MKSAITLAIFLTLLIAVQADFDDLKAVKQTTCVPGSTFRQDCNECRCRADGTVGGCTRRLCASTTTPSSNPAN